MKRANPLMIVISLFLFAALLWHSPFNLQAQNLAYMTAGQPEDPENKAGLLGLSENPQDDTEEDDSGAVEEPDTQEPENGEESTVVINVTAESMDSAGGARKTIQKALNKARKYATAQKPYVIKVEAGSYILTEGILHVYSYTTLDLTGVTLHRAKTNNMIRVGATNECDDKDGVTGYYYTDIHIIGGVFDGSGLAGTVIKVGHASNFTMSGSVVQNAKNAHLMEAAGTDGLNVTDCVFRDQQLDRDNDDYTYEAIQLDILYNRHFVGYRSEPLTVKNVNITDCTFSDVPRGIGTHTAIQNLPMENITIKRCVFNSMKSAAIHGQGWINCHISDNKISKSPRGIVLYSVLNQGQGVYTAKAVASEGKVSTSIPSSYARPLADQQIVISNNTITLNDAQDPYVRYSRGAIIVSGSNVKSSVKYDDGSGRIAKGNYYVSGISISGNRITTTGHGIRILDGQNCLITGNKITGKKSSSDSTEYYGIQAREGCRGIAIQKNTIKKAISTGIFIAANSSATMISSNTVTSPGKYGIDVEQSTATSIVSNKITSPAQMGIFVYYSSTVDLIKKNSISSSKGSGIYVVYLAKVVTVSGNTVKSSRNYGVSVTESSRITNLKSNTLFASGTKAVYKDRYSTISSDSNNLAFDTPKLSAAKNHKSGIKVTWKKVSHAGSYLIYRKTKGGSWEKIASSPSNSYIDREAVSGKKYYYTVRAAEDGKARSGFSTAGVSCYYLATPKLAAPKGGTKKMTVAWKAVSKSTGYTIQYSTSKSFRKYKTKTVSSAKTLQKKITKLVKNKTYYIRIRSFRKTKDKVYYSAWSSTKSVEIA